MKHCINISSKDIAQTRPAPASKSRNANKPLPPSSDFCTATASWIEHVGAAHSSLIRTKRKKQPGRKRENGKTGLENVIEGT